eukprot:16330-Heterococcus_DN1.PRE.7
MSAEDAAVAEQDEAVLRRARQLVRTDRDLLEKGTRAFVAFVRAYKCSACVIAYRATSTATCLRLERFSYACTIYDH